MPNSMRRLTPEERPEEYEVSRNPNQPENDNNGAVGGAVAARPRDDNSLSFRHFLQPHSDVVPQPPPTRNRSSRGSHPGGVDLVDVTMAGLPDFVQDHLIMESLASGEQLHDLSPSRQHVGHPLDLNVLNEILPEFGSSSQRNPRRNSQGASRRSGHEPQPTNGDNPINQTPTLPDFLSDGPMQLNHNDASAAIPSPSASSSRSTRCRPQLENLADEPVRGPSFESKETLRLEIELLRSEVSEKNRRLSQMEVDLSRQRTTTNSLEVSLRTAERNLTEATKRATDTEKQLVQLMKGSSSSMENGHGDGSCGNSNPELAGINASRVLNIAISSENLISQLSAQMEELKRLALHADIQTDEEATKELKKSKH